MYKNIVVCINEVEGRENIIRAAAKFANEINANLSGVYLRVRNIPPALPYEVLSEKIIAATIEQDEQLAELSKELFQKITREFRCKSDWLEFNSEYDVLKLITYTDVVINNQISNDLHQGMNDVSFINTLILQTGKPLILIPSDWSEPNFGSKVVVGWDESRAATRAVQDAMPLLKIADHVDAVCVNYKEHDDPVDVSDISNYLSERNVSNAFKLRVTDEYLDTPEKVLHDYACRSSANLIVIGGYGHSRLREIILGGVTRYLSKHSRVPVLFSH